MALHLFPQSLLLMHHGGSVCLLLLLLHAGLLLLLLGARLVWLGLSLGVGLRLLGLRLRLRLRLALTLLRRRGGGGGLGLLVSLLHHRRLVWVTLSLLRVHRGLARVVSLRGLLLGYLHLLGQDELLLMLQMLARKKTGEPVYPHMVLRLDLLLLHAMLCDLLLLLLEMLRQVDRSCHGVSSAHRLVLCLGDLATHPIRHHRYHAAILLS